MMLASTCFKGLAEPESPLAAQLWGCVRRFRPNSKYVANKAFVSRALKRTEAHTDGLKVGRLLEEAAITGSSRFQMGEGSVQNSGVAVARPL